jgi:hypothetical protein
VTRRVIQQATDPVAARGPMSTSGRTDESLDPLYPEFAPLAQAIGRAVLGVAGLEKVLLVEIAQRRAHSQPVAEKLGQELRQLETKPAGVLLKALRALGIPAATASRIQDVIEKRNQLVHRFAEFPGMLAAIAMRSGMAEIVRSVDAISIECQALINEIAPTAFGGAEGALGTSLPMLLEMARSVDLDTVDDAHLRSQLELIRQVPQEDLNQLVAEDDE